MRALLPLAFGVLAVLGIPCAASAESITIEFSAVVDLAWGGALTEYGVGGLVQGHYTYVSDASDSESTQGDIGQYRALTTISVELQGDKWHLPSPSMLPHVGGSSGSFIEVVNSVAGEQYFVRSTETFDTVPGGWGALRIFYLGSGWVQDGRHELDGIRLPTDVPFEPADYTLMLRFGPGHGLDASVSSIRVSHRDGVPVPVPEPSTLALLGLSISALVWRRRRA